MYHPLTLEELESVYSAPGTVTGFSMKTLLGETLGEKREGIFVKIVEVANVIKAKTGHDDKFWVVCDPVSAMYFESCYGLHEAVVTEKAATSCGELHGKWHFYRHPHWEEHILIGHGDTVLHHKNYARLYLIDLKSESAKMT